MPHFSTTTTTQAVLPERAPLISRARWCVAVGREADVEADVGVDVATSTNCVVNVLCTVMFIWRGCACVCVCIAYFTLYIHAYVRKYVSMYKYIHMFICMYSPFAICILSCPHTSNAERQQQKKNKTCDMPKKREF